MEGERSDRLWLALAALAGVMLFLHRFGTTPLHPAQVDWLLAKDDPAFHFLGWQYFRLDAWRWPLGRMENYYAPIGTSVALTDSIPLLAVLCKLISPVLPMPFQYFGWWLLGCYALQGLFAYLLLHCFTRNGASACAGALLFLAAPAFLMRTAHLALCAHWLLLAALYLYFRRPRRDGMMGQVPWLLLTAAASGVHAYLCVMVWGVYAAYAMRDIFESPRQWSGHALAMGIATTSTVCTWYTLGYFEGGPGSSAGPPFGMYNLNLNSFLNAAGWSGAGYGVAIG